MEKVGAKVFLAGTPVSVPDKHTVVQELFRSGNKLHSFYHCKSSGFEEAWFKMNVKNKVNLFLDSGAFSAKSKGAKIDIAEYIDFIKEHKDSIDVYANLDVIGDAEATWKNQEKMEKAGLNPLPVFHLEEKMNEQTAHGYLNRCLEYSYFCLGGMAKGYSSVSRNHYLDWCFRIICDTPDNMPKSKVHGFGIAAFNWLLTYPWYSIDSSTWSVVGRMGSILVPRTRNGEWDYSRAPLKIGVTIRNPGKHVQDQHIDTLSETHRDEVLRYVESKGYRLGFSRSGKASQDRVLRPGERWAGKKPTDKTEKRILEVVKEDGLCNRYELRDELNIIFFLDLEKHLPKWPRPFVSPQRVEKMF